MRKLLFLILLGTIFLEACNKDEMINTNPSLKLTTSTDSVLFDTVFTSVGSTTRRFQIFNFNKNALQINAIKLGGGSNSPFKVNVNGREINNIPSLTIYGNDSVNVLIKVTINPSLQEQPFIVKDSLIFQYNGNRIVVPIQAYGQNAIFLDNAQINTNTTWNSRLPYIIKKGLTVAENTILTIAGGTRILFHRDAKFIVKGTLIASGTKADSILFASDRMERIYQEEPGQWSGIHLTSTSQNSIINHAMIKNALIGLQVDSMSNSPNPKLTLANSIVKNMQLVGFLGYHTSLAAYNNLFYNCGQYLIDALGGGNYELVQNTFVAYNFNFARRNPALYFSDTNGNTKNETHISISNSIIWGSLDNELVFEKKTPLNSVFSANNCLIKSTQNFSGANNLYNIDPFFVSPRLGNYQLAENSLAIGKGLDLHLHQAFNTYLKYDILGKQRLFPSELGCFERD